MCKHTAVQCRTSFQANIITKIKLLDIMPINSLEGGIRNYFVEYRTRTAGYSKVTISLKT